MDPNLSLRPGPSRRKSSNLLASLARQNTLSEREKEVSHLDGISETGSLYQGGNSGGTGSYLLSSNASIMSSSTATTSAGGLSAPSAPTAQNTPSSQSNFGVALENLRYLLQKRTTTFNYLKRAHEGKVHWFNTILLTREELDAAFDNSKMQKRTVRFAVLGMSLSVLLEITAAHDFLRGLLSLLQEYDTITDENFKAKTKNLFKAGKGKRPSGAADYPLNMQDSGDHSYFFSPNIPFDLDYFQVLYTLCDIMCEVYQKIMSFLGPSTAGNVLPTLPGYPQPLPNQHLTPPVASNASNNGSASSLAGAGQDRRIAVGLSPMLVEVVLKIDGKLKRIIGLVTKELDMVARSAIKEELTYISTHCLGSGGLEGLYGA